MRSAPDIWGFHAKLAARLRMFGSAPSSAVKILTLAEQTSDSCAFLDVEEDRPGQSARIYIFWRDVA